MTFLDRLQASAELSGNIACMGLDLVGEYLPEATGDFQRDAIHFVERVFSLMNEHGVIPAAFKPNIGYYQGIDSPRKGDFSGSKALVGILELCDSYFPQIPVIIDSKRGDIARSSLNYAWEGFDSWGGDAITVSPYMGEDSVSPFWDNFLDRGRGIYILNRTSNPGSKSFQSKLVEGKPLYLVVAEAINHWAKEHPGVGAVVGATSLQELEDIARLYGSNGVPLLIPGVGSQGGSGSDTMETLGRANYSLTLARINSSSGITHPWKGGAIPQDWAGRVVQNLENLIKELAI